MFSFIYEIELVFLFEIHNKDGDSQSSQSVCMLPTCQRARLGLKKLLPLHNPGSQEEWHLEVQTVCCSTCYDKGISLDPRPLWALIKAKGRCQCCTAPSLLKLRKVMKPNTMGLKRMYCRSNWRE